MRISISETPSGVLTKIFTKVKKPTTLKDYKAYAFGFTVIAILCVTPFAIMAILKTILQ